MSDTENPDIVEEPASKNLQTTDNLPLDASFVYTALF